MENVLPRRLRLPTSRGGRRSPRRRPQGVRAVLLTLRKPSRRIVLIVLLAAVILSGGFLWFRGSSFVAVERVQISGVQGVEAGSVEAALVEEARRMSTMDVSVGALEAAVARFHLVRSIAVKASFPHSLAISVTERLPVAVLSFSGQRTAVAEDGLVLGASLASAGLPALPVSFQLSAGQVVGSHRLRSFLTVLGAAPAPLLRLVSRIYHGPQGLTLKMRDSLLVYFGDDSRPHAKWASLAAVLSDPESAGATYVDVRLPERPAAGMPEGVEADSAEGDEVSATDPSSAALAASLAGAFDGGVTTSAALTTAEAPEEGVEAAFEASEAPEEGVEAVSTEATEETEEAAVAAEGSAEDSAEASYGSEVGGEYAPEGG